MKSAYVCPVCKDDADAIQGADTDQIERASPLNKDWEYCLTTDDNGTPVLYWHADL